MNRLKMEFVELCIANQVLRFGEFTLKSGRVSPYFFNTGLFNRGDLLSQLAKHYARVIIEKLNPQTEQPDFMLYGPAYKGIPLAAATAIQLADQHHINIGYAFNRKEAKNHGEGGNVVGAELSGNVVIIDDVITAGTSVRESVAMIQSAGATPHSVVIALDRQETADGQEKSAVQCVEDEHGIPVHPIITLQDLIEYLTSKASKTATKKTDSNIAEVADKYTAAIKAYQDRYQCQR